MHILDQSKLHQGVEVVIKPLTKKIKLAVAGNMTAEGVSLQTLYSFIKKEWRDDPALIKYDFPFNSYGEQYELINGWNFEDVATINLVKDFGWAVKDAAGVSLEEYMNIKTIGGFEDETDTAYYIQDSSPVPVEMPIAGALNHAIKIYGDATHGNVNNKSLFQVLLREQGKTYSFADLSVSQNINAFTFKSYVLALSNKIDTKIAALDSIIETQAPYTGMSIKFEEMTVNINGVDRDFGVVIDGNFGTLEQIYEFVQYQLRKPTNINAAAGGMQVRGDTCEELLVFIADTIKARSTAFGSVYIKNFRSIDINRIIFTMFDGTEVVYPFMAAGTIIFNETIKNDMDAKFWMFFTDDSAATTPTGKNFGTANAIIVNDKNNAPITGGIAGASQVSFEYDYTSNEQRGVGSAGKNAPVTVVVQGLGTAQYTKVSGIIERSIYNVFSLVGNRERNYVS